MKSILLICVTNLLTVSSTLAYAETTFSIRAEGGLSGYGGALLFQTSPYLSFALGYNGGKVNWKDNIKINGINYDIDMNNNRAYLNATLRPWTYHEQSWLRAFHTTLGIGYIGDNYDIHQNFKIGEVRPSQLNRFIPKNVEIDAKGSLDYGNPIAPYLGIGLSPKFTSTWSGFFEIGVYYTGSPTVRLTHLNNHEVKADSKFTHYKLDDSTFFKWHPVAKAGIAYSF
jgi:hypothetical protein